MQGAVLYGARDIRFEDRAEPTIVEPTDAIISLPVTCICGSDLWPRATTARAARGRHSRRDT
jgi:threonine dehydrogenase-like Zn-dependent dehydrogenase